MFKLNYIANCCFAVEIFHSIECQPQEKRAECLHTRRAKFCSCPFIRCLDISEDKSKI